MEIRDKELAEIRERVNKMQRNCGNYLKVINNGDKIKVLLRKIERRDGRSKVRREGGL